MVPADRVPGTIDQPAPVRKRALEPRTSKMDQNPSLPVPMQGASSQEAKRPSSDPEPEPIEDDEPEPWLYWHGSLSCFSPGLAVPREACEDCSRSGPVDDAVAYWVPRCRDWPTDDALRRELAECGAWDDLETVETDTLRERTLFVIADMLLENEKEA